MTPSGSTTPAAFAAKPVVRFDRHHDTARRIYAAPREFGGNFARGTLDNLAIHPRSPRRALDVLLSLADIRAPCHRCSTVGQPLNARPRIDNIAACYRVETRSPSPPTRAATGAALLAVIGTTISVG